MSEKLFSVDTIIMVVALFGFGIAFNALVERLDRRPEGHDGYTSLLVVVGVIVTVTATLIHIPLEDYLIIALAFCASGIPMIVGSIRRYMDARDAVAARIISLMTTEGSDGHGSA